MISIFRVFINKYGKVLEKYHMIDASRELYRKYVNKGLFPDIYYRPEKVNIDIKMRTPFEDSSILPYKDFLEENAHIIRNELLNVINENIGSWDCLKLTSELNKWKAIRIGKSWKQNRELFPQTIKILSYIDSKYGFNLRNMNDSIKFSIINPNTHIVPHCGDSNDRLRIHLGLIIPQGCYIRCRDEIKKWEENKILILDDTFEHEVWNWSEEKRAILIIDIWKPQLTKEEIQYIKSIKVNN